MGWSISEVARVSGVTSRTLRHYDAIGLLPPAWTDHSGRRFYEQDDLLRLQRILLLRDLGLGLDAVAEVLAAQDRGSQLDVLKRHRDWLTEERKRLGKLIRTVDRTMTSLEEGVDMTAETMFDGFAHNPYEAEARERWGDMAVNAANARVKDWTKDDWAEYKAESAAVTQRIAELFDANAATDDAQVLDAVDGHYRVVCRFWTPNREAYIGLGQMYVNDERFARNYEDVRPGLAAYMRDAMKVYAEANL